MKIKNVGFFFAFFFKIHPKFRDFINFDDCIRKITSKSIRLYTVFNKKNGFNKINIISGEKIRNSDNF